MKLKYQFVIREVAGQTVAVPVGQESQHLRMMIKLNDTARFLMEQLSSETSEAELTAALQRKYAIDHETAKGAVDDFLEQLHRSELLETV